jgi:hypothetical protein
MLLQSQIPSDTYLMLNGFSMNTVQQTQNQKFLLGILKVWLVGVKIAIEVANDNNCDSLNW